MPQRRMNRITEEVFETLALDAPGMVERMGELSPREYYKKLPDHEKNAVGLLVYTAAFLHSEGSSGVAEQKKAMQEDARRKGETGEQLLNSNLRVADALERLRATNYIGGWFYVEQASSDDIQNGLDAQGADWVIEDRQGDRPGFKILQGGTTPRNVALKTQDLERFYGEHMTEGQQIVGLFPTLDRNSNLLESEEMAEFILNALSNTAPVAPGGSR